MRISILSIVASAALLVNAPASAQIKIGFVATMSGPAGVLGQDMYDGFMLGVEHAGGKLGGQNVQVIKEDDQLKPDLGTQIVQKLIEKERVQIITGITFSNVMMAIHKPVVDAGVFLIGSNAGPAPLAGPMCSPYFFSTSWVNDQQHESVGKYATDKGYKRMVIMAPNYQAGKDALTGFKRFFKGNVLNEVYTQLNQPDYAAEITQLQVDKPDAVYVFYPGAMGINFIKQYQQAGLLGKVPLVSGSTVDGANLPALKETALGVISGSQWGPDIDNPVNRKFVADFEKKFSRVPSQYAAQSYDSALLLDSAIRKVKGNVSDKKGFMAALKAADFKSARGPFKFNTNNFPIENFYIFEVAKNAKGRIDLVTRQLVLENHKDAYYTQCSMK